MRVLLTTCLISFLFINTYSYAGEAMDVKADLLKTSPAESMKDKKTESKMKIEGIFIGGGRAFAIINGRVYHEGSYVLGHKLITIQKGSIVLSRGGKTSVHEVDR